MSKPADANPNINILSVVVLRANSTYNFPDDLLIDVRIDCHVPATPLGVAVSPPLDSVMPLAVASLADQTEVLGVTGPPSHAWKPGGGGTFVAQAGDWRVKTNPGVWKDIPANNAPTVAGTNEIIGNVPVAGLLLLTHTLFFASQTFPAVKSHSERPNVPGNRTN